MSHNTGSMMARGFSTPWAVLVAIAALSLCPVLTREILHAQERPPLSPPVNHEAGRIAQIITAVDAGYRFRGYVLNWRSTQVVVSGPAEEARVVGNDLDIVVYRTEVNGHRILRFAADVPAVNEDEVDRESKASSAAITQGTAQIESSISANSDGYQYVGYFVTWHGQHVFVVDPLSAPARANGETINFRVIRSGSQLSFAL